MLQRGRQVFMDALRAHGVTRIFGNPGTTESPLLDSLVDYPDIEYKVFLHEGLAVGAAGFYAQASGGTGVVSMHVAPGLGNSIGMLYGAMKANSPMIVTAGQQDTRMRLRDPVLGHDLVAMAAPVTKWAVQVERADEMAEVMRRAFKVAHSEPKGPVFVSLPIDVMEQETEISAQDSGPIWHPTNASEEAVEQALQLLTSASHPVIVASDDVAREKANDELVKLAQAIGAPVWTETLRAQNPFPNKHPLYRGNLPLDNNAISHNLGDADLVILIGGPFFEEVWHRDTSPMPAGAKILQLENNMPRLAHNHHLDLGIHGSIRQTLQSLNQRLQAIDDLIARGSQRHTALIAQNEVREAKSEARRASLWDASPMTPLRALSEIASVTPQNAIVVDETITAIGDVIDVFDLPRAGDWFAGRGGGIGQGLAGAIGISVAQPERPVLCLSGDGSSMYSIQALWTAAHHNLNILFVILNNQEYRVLKHNLETYRKLFDAASNQDFPHMDLDTPNLKFPELAAGMGVPGQRIEDAAQIAPAVEAALQAGGPQLLEIRVSGKQ